MSGEFSKYEEEGAYHWKALYDQKWFRQSPRLHARYDIPIRLLSIRLDLRESLGLDVGCGDGVLLYKIRKSGGDVVGLDNSAEGLRLAEQKLDARGVSSVRLVNSSCYDIPFDKSSFDYVTGIELIEHLDDVDAFLDEASRVLRPGGWFVCTTPNRAEDQPSDKVRDPFHVHEFVADELSEVLGRVFENTNVYGAYPESLDEIYVRDKKLGYVDKGVRLMFRMFSYSVLNPYVRWVENKPSWNNSLLVGVSRK